MDRQLMVEAGGTKLSGAAFAPAHGLPVAFDGRPALETWWKQWELILSKGENDE
jgi:hypothetical protein